MVLIINELLWNDLRRPASAIPDDQPHQDYHRAPLAPHGNNTAFSIKIDGDGGTIKCFDTRAT
jgi:hypothetical protein